MDGRTDGRTDETHANAVVGLKYVSESKMRYARIVASRWLLEIHTYIKNEFSSSIFLAPHMS